MDRVTHQIMFNIFKRRRLHVQHVILTNEFMNERVCNVALDLLELQR